MKLEIGLAIKASTFIATTRDQDKLAIGIKDPSVFTVKNEGRPMKFKSKNQLLVLVAQIGDATS